MIRFEKIKAMSLEELGYFLSAIQWDSNEPTGQEMIAWLLEEWEDLEEVESMINEFKGQYYFLSNFYTAPVTWCGITYQNNEAAFQSAKVLDNSLREEFAVLDPASAKKMGRRVHLRDDWETVKYNVMYEICLAKFSQNENLKARLLETGDKHLEEGNTWGDKIWGTVNGEGENNLGKILMRVRAELR